MVDLDDAMALTGTMPTVLVHGGGAGIVLAGIDDAIAAPTLVLEGIARWARVQ